MAGGVANPEAERLKAQGNEKLKAGQLKEALALYEQALAKLPGKVSSSSPLATLSASVALNAALACLQLEDWEAAEGFASRALRSFESSKGYFRRGLARAQIKGLHADAKRDFEFALKLEPAGSAAARQVEMELQRLLHTSAGGNEAPADADPSDVKRYEIFNAQKQQQGLREVTWLEWQALERQVATAAAAGEAWKKRLQEACKCPTPGVEGEEAVAAQLDRLASKASKHKSSSELVEAVAVPRPAQGLRGVEGEVQFAALGPWLFDGSSVDLSYEPLANPAGSFTVECWAACNGCTGHQCILASRDVREGLKAGYCFFVEPEGVWSFWVGTGKAWEKLYGSSVTLGRWTHLRGTVDAKSKEAQFYVDQRLVARGWAGYVANQRKPLRLGAGCPEAQPKFFFKGDLRDVVVIGRVVEGDVSAEVSKLRGSLDSMERLRQMKGLEGSCACASALHAAVVGLQPTGDFRSEALRFLESTMVQGVRALFLSFRLGAVLSSPGAEELELSFGSLGVEYWAVILQSGSGYKVLYEADICKLSECIARQKQWRSKSNGWLTRKDVALWLSALDILTQGAKLEDIEDALLTVFLFGFWASKTLTPQVRVKRFEPRRCGEVKASMAELSSEAWQSLLQSLAE